MAKSLNFLCLKTFCRCKVVITAQLYECAECGNLSLHRAFDRSCDAEAEMTQQSIFIVFRLPRLQKNFDKVERPDGGANLSLEVDVITLLNFKFFRWRRQPVVR